MTLIEFTVPGDPVGQGRPRFSRHGRYVQTYDPPKSRQYKALVTKKLQQVYADKPMTCPVKITVKAYFSVPKSYSKHVMHDCLSGVQKPDKKPDADNIIKGIMDAMNGIAYEDDKQVVSMHVYKTYAPVGCVKVTIEEIEIAN